MIVAAAVAFAATPLAAAEFPHGDVWRQRFAAPDGFAFTRKAEKVDSSERDGYTLETWRQANGPASFQRVLVAVPKGAKGKLPAVVVTIENPDSMFEAKPKDGVAFAADLAKRGYVTVSSDCGLSGKKMSGWSGMGRLAHNARLLVDLAEADQRIDKGRIGMVGHGAGAKVAYCAGLLDKRVTAVGVGYLNPSLSHPSWSEARFWGDDAAEMVKEKLSNFDLILQSDAKPMFFLRGGSGSDTPEDRSFFWRALADRTNCKDKNAVIRRYTRSDERAPLGLIPATELYVFLDDSVKAGDNPPKQYQGGRVRLFERGDKVEGKVSSFVRIPAIAVAPDGSVIVVFDARQWHNGDLFECQPMYTVVMRSTDCGKTWSAPKALWKFPWNEREKFGAGDPSLVVDNVAGKVFCFVNVMEYARGRNEYRFFVWESRDNGVTWSEPREITDDISWPGVVHGNHSAFITSGHGIQRKDGALMHTVLQQRFGVSVFGSEDHGRTWKCFGNPTGETNEAKVEELADGTWMINNRCGRWCRQVSRSSDCGKTWTNEYDMNLIDTEANGATLTVTLKDGRQALLLSNASRAVRPRMYITLRASLDGGRSWNKGVVIDPGACEYSDCAYMRDGRVAVVYEGEGERTIDFVAVPLEEVLGAK